MRILFVNAVKNQGGAAKAAHRIALAVRAQGHDVEFLTMDDGSGAQSCMMLTMRKVLDRLPVLACRNRWRLLHNLEFSCATLRRDFAGQVNRFGADVVNLHWVNYGQISPEGLARIRAPVVWTLHDMWAFTGGCHHSRDCLGFTERCGVCPVLGSGQEDDISRGLWLRKKRAWQGRTIHVVTPSTWLGERAAASALFKEMPIRTIPNPVDLKRFSPGNKAEARRALGLPAEPPLVLFAAQKALGNPAKGYHLLEQAMRGAWSDGKPPHLVVLGSGTPGTFSDTPFPTHFLGYHKDETAIVNAYRSADVFVLPSLNENLPNTIAEALACGTPCVAYSVGGIPDMIRHRENGYLAQPFEAADLHAGLETCLNATNQDCAMSASARTGAERMFDAAKIGRAYLDVFRHAMGEKTQK